MEISLRLPMKIFFHFDAFQRYQPSAVGPLQQGIKRRKECLEFFLGERYDETD